MCSFFALLLPLQRSRFAALGRTLSGLKSVVHIDDLLPTVYDRLSAMGSCLPMQSHNRTIAQGGSGQCDGDWLKPLRVCIC